MTASLDSKKIRTLTMDYIEAHKKWFIRHAVEELRREWRDIINQSLTSRERSLVFEPTFVIHADMTQWGRWRGGDLRQLELHERLLFEHPWYAVTDVLRHEIAHQLRECLYPNSEEPPHGPLFRQLCERLGANPAASGHYPTIDQQMRMEDTGGEDDPRSALMTRVQKLLTLAERAESHEAEAALAKARSLMARHDLDEGALAGEDNSFVSVCLSQEASLHRPWEVSALGNLLQDFWGVKTLWVYEPFWDANHSQFQLGWNLEISGRLERVRVASYVYDYLRSYISRSWEALPTRMRGGQRKRRDYALGVIHGFRTVLERQDAQEDTAAVIKKGEAGLEDYFAARHPNVRATRQNLKRNQEQYAAGQAAGQKVRIAPGLEDGQSSSGPRLLN